MSKVLSDQEIMDVFNKAEKLFVKKGFVVLAKQFQIAFKPDGADPKFIISVHELEGVGDEGISYSKSGLFAEFWDEAFVPHFGEDLQDSSNAFFKFHKVLVETPKMIDQLIDHYNSEKLKTLKQPIQEAAQ